MKRLTDTYKEHKDVVMQINQKLIRFKKKWKTIKSVTKPHEPILFLIRQDKTWEVVEEPRFKEGKFRFKHSNGTTREMTIDPSFLYQAKWGKDTLKAYFVHEDHLLPLVPSPLAIWKEVQKMVEEAMSVNGDWRAKQTKAMSQLVLYVGVGVAIVIGAVVIYRIVVPSQPPVSQTEMELLKQIATGNLTVVKP